MSSSSLELRISSDGSGMSFRSNVSRTVKEKKIVISPSPTLDGSELSDAIVLCSSEFVQNSQVDYATDERRRTSQDMFGSSQDRKSEISPRSTSPSLSLKVLLSSNPSSNSSSSSLRVVVSSDQPSVEEPNNEQSGENSGTVARKRTRRSRNSPDLFGSSSVSRTAQTQRRASASADATESLRSDSQLWNTQHLAQVSEELQVRPQQLKRLICKLVKRKRLSDECLTSLKKRLRKL